MPLPLTLQQRLEMEARARAAVSQPQWMGNPLVAPLAGPQAGVPASGVPYTGFPLPTVPSVAFPTLPSLDPVVQNVGQAAAQFPGQPFRAALDAGMQNVSDVGQFFARQGAPKPVKGAAPVQSGQWDFITRPESGNNPNARNPNSSASGLGQFLNDTWMDQDLRKRAGYAGVDDATWARFKQGEEGKAAQISMVAAYAQRNAEHWEKAMGQPPSNGQLYGMHFLDAGPFILLTQTASTNPTADATKLFPKAAAANPSIFYRRGAGGNRLPKTAAEVYEELTHKGDTDPFDQPDLPRMDPRMANALPMPGRPREVSLPDAPQMPDMPARPQQEELPISQWMEQLRAFAPKSFDEKAANQGRLQAVIAGLARGAANADARQGAGAMLAAMGAGASSVSAAWTDRLKAERSQADEAVRMFELGLARQGIDWQAKNQGVRQQNREAQWQDSRDKLLNSYQNKTNQWEVETREYLQNNNILRQYDSDVFGAKTARARMALGIVEFNTQQTSREITGQAELDLKRFLFEDEKSARAISDDTSKAVAAMANEQGIVPALVYKNKDQVGANALQGFAYIAARNKPAAIKSLGAEIVYSDMIDLIPDEKKRNEIRGLVMKGNPELAAEHVGRLLLEEEAKTPGASLVWAKALAAKGLPVGTALLRRAATEQPGVK